MTTFKLNPMTTDAVERLAEKSLEPPENPWGKYTQPEYIEGVIYDICEDIAKRGYRTNYLVPYDVLYNYILDNIEKFVPEKDIEDEID